MARPAIDSPAIDYDQLKQTFLSTKNDRQLYRAIVNEPFQQCQVQIAYLFLGLMTLFVADTAEQWVNLGDVSDTELYNLAVEGYTFDPYKYRLSLEKDGDNDIVKAIRNGKPQATTDWNTLRRADADPGKVEMNQASSGIAYSVIYPLDIPHGGALLFCYFQYQEQIGEAQENFMKAYVDIVSQALTQRRG